MQVKTSIRALRYRGRKGKDSHPDHYEWDVGERSGQLNQSDLFFAFVDLKGVGTELPDVFIIPSEVIFKQFDKPYFKAGVKRRWRFHPKIDWLEKYKNNWQSLKGYLEGKGGFYD